jgi:hypothetical protein
VSIGPGSPLPVHGVQSCPWNGPGSCSTTVGCVETAREFPTSTNCLCDHGVSGSCRYGCVDQQGNAAPCGSGPNCFCCCFPPQGCTTPPAAVEGQDQTLGGHPCSSISLPAPAASTCTAGCSVGFSGDVQQYSCTWWGVGQASTWTDGPYCSNCLEPVGLCDWYRMCVEAMIPCSSDNYAIDYGMKYCDLYDRSYGDFSSTGQQWVDAVRLCLQKALVLSLQSAKAGNPPSCRALKATAFASHVPCYSSPAEGLSVCSLWSVKDYWLVWTTIDSAFEPGNEFVASAKQAFLVATQCVTKAVSWARVEVQGLVQTTVDAVHSTLDSLRTAISHAASWPLDRVLLLFNDGSATPLQSLYRSVVTFEPSVSVDVLFLPRTESDLPVASVPWQQDESAEHVSSQLAIFVALHGLVFNLTIISNSSGNPTVTQRSQTVSSVAACSVGPCDRAPDDNGGTGGSKNNTTAIACGVIFSLLGVCLVGAGVWYYWTTHRMKSYRSGENEFRAKSVWSSHEHETSSQQNSPKSAPTSTATTTSLEMPGLSHNPIFTGGA